MSDRLDRDTVERMLRGEDAGPPELASWLAAASAAPVQDELRGEEAAVTAFREARSGVAAPAPSRRRILRSRLLAIKAALAGFLLVLGGVAVAASPHLPVSHGTKHTPAPRTPATSQSAEKRLTVPVPSPAPEKRRADPRHGYRRGRSSHHRRTSGDGWKGRPTPGGAHDRYEPSFPSLPIPVSRPPVCDAHCPWGG